MVFVNRKVHARHCPDARYEPILGLAMYDHETETQGVTLNREACFGPFRLIPSRRLLLCDGKPIRLGAPAHNVLVVLVEKAGEIVDRNTLIERAWRTTHLEESNLRSAIAALRRTFSAAGCSRSYVDTVARRGYRFVEPVTFGESIAVRQDVPAQLSKVVGRDAFVSDLVADIARRRLITIVGPGGIGKSVVAMCAARMALSAKHVDSVSIVGLDAAVDSKLLVNALRAGLGVVARNDDSVDDIESFLENRRVLILLDNCERMIGPVAKLVERILASAPNVVVLATSREPMRAEGEAIRRIEPLPLPPLGAKPSAFEALKFAAVDLFVDRATLTRPSFKLTDNITPMVVNICRSLDGVPLAIEMAATSMDAFELPVLVDVLGGHFRLRMLGRGTALPRHRTLSATLEWSFETLSGQEQTVFRRLSVFKGPFSILAARHIVADDGISTNDVSGLLAGLAAKSLITAGGTSAPGTHRLLETTRAYACEKLKASGEFDLVARRHATYYGTILTNIWVQVNLNGNANWRDVRGPELEQFRAALEWAISSSGDSRVERALRIEALTLWCHLDLENEQAVGSNRSNLISETIGGSEDSNGRGQEPRKALDAFPETAVGTWVGGLKFAAIVPDKDLSQTIHASVQKLVISIHRIFDQSQDHKERTSGTSTWFV